jgi:hypothetical protein
MTDQGVPTMRDIAKELARVVGVAPPPNPTSAERAEWSTERLTFSAALLERAFLRLGWSAAYVGGGVLQFHLGGEGYQTGDVDMVVAQRTGTPVPRAALDEAMHRLGGRSSGSRHWIFGVPGRELFVEIPGHELPLEPDRVPLTGDLTLTMDPVEHVITGRIVEFHNTGNADYALQAIHALRALRNSLDHVRLERYIREERVVEASALIAALVDRPGEITVALLAYAYDMLREKARWCDLRDPDCGPLDRDH